MHKVHVHHVKLKKQLVNLLQSAEALKDQLLEWQFHQFNQKKKLKIKNK